MVTVTVFKWVAVTECSAVTKQVVAKNGSEYVNMHLRKRACASRSTGDEEVINLKRCKHLTDRTGHVGLRR